MIKKIKFWFDFIKEALNVYENTCVNHGFNPLAKESKKTNNVQSTKRG